jgi:hypothetical protein
MVNWIVSSISMRNSVGCRLSGGCYLRDNGYDPQSDHIVIEFIDSGACFSPHALQHEDRLVK